MVRKNYFEILDNMSFDPKAELDSLLGLLNKKEHLKSVYYLSLKHITEPTRPL